jgi:hypothetical protein
MLSVVVSTGVITLKGVYYCIDQTSRNLETRNTRTHMMISFVWPNDLV